MNIARKINITNEYKQIRTILVELSKKHGGAWVYILVQFSHVAYFKRFKFPRNISDGFIYRSRENGEPGIVGYKGQIQLLKPELQK